MQLADSPLPKFPSAREIATRLRIDESFSYFSAAGVLHIAVFPSVPMPIDTHSVAGSVPTMLTDAPSVRQKGRDLRISCIVPCLNECENLRVLLPALASMMEKLCTSWEIMVIDDGSVDGTADLMTHLCATDGFRYLQLSRNFGKEAAVSAGLESATGNVVICLDADMQHPPALIPDMLSRWRAGVDMVYAVREHRKAEHWLKRVGANLFYRLLGQAQGVHVPPHASDFRLMDWRVVQALKALPERTRFMKGLYAWVGFRVEALPYTPEMRAHGASRFNGRRLCQLAFTGLTAFTTWPLRVVSLLGFLSAFLSFTYGCYVVVDNFLYGNPVSGWTTIVTTVLFSAGVNLLFLGVVGEYVGRIFDEVKGRPLYIVREQRGQAFTEQAQSKE